MYTPTPPTAPGTASVPGAAAPGSSDANTVALQTLVAALATFTQAQAAPAQPPPPTTAAPAVVVPAAPGFSTRAPWVAGSLYVVVPGAPLTAIVEAADADPERSWYCITRGKYVGVTLSNPLALAAVSGVSSSAMKGHKGQLLAIDAFNEMLGLGLVAVLSQ